MKYLKKFEKIPETKKEVYNIGDYIKFKNRILSEWKKYNHPNIFKYAKIIGVNKKNDESNLILEVINNNIIDTFYVFPKFFERKLTTKEIEEFELKKYTLKYNL